MRHPSFHIFSEPQEGQRTYQHQKYLSPGFKKPVKVVFLINQPLKTLTTDRYDVKMRVRKIKFEGLKKDGSILDLKSFLAKLEAYQAELSAIDTEMKEVTVHVPGTQPIYVAFPADLHVGSVGGRYSTLLRKFKLMREIPRLYAVNGGDVVDNFLPSKHPEGSFEMICPPHVQKLIVEKLFDILRGRWVAMVKGDHENFSWLSDDFDFTAYIAEKMGCANLGFGGFINIKLGTQMYRIGIRHRYRFNSSFNLTHTVKRMREQLGDFDVGVVAHNHRAAVEHMNFPDKDRIFIRPGAFKMADNYAKKIGFIDGARTCVIPAVKLWGDRRKIKAYFDISEIADELGIKIPKKKKAKKKKE